MLGVSNPVLTRELRTGLRGHRAFLLRTAFVTVLAIVVIVTWMTALAGMTGSWREATLDVRTIPGLGRELFAALGTALLVLLLALIPGYAAAGITSERETRTLEMMLCTWLKPRHIVLGKLGASTVFAIGLLLSSLPAVSAVFLLGGVSPLEFGLLFLLLLSTAIFVGALSLFVSSHCTKTYMAVMITYVVIGGLHYAGPLGARVALWGAGHARLLSQSAADFLGATVEEIPEMAEFVNPVLTSRSLFEGAIYAPAVSRGDVGVPPTSAPVALIRDRRERVRFVALHSVSPAVMLLGALVLVMATSRAVARATNVVGPPLTQRIARWITRHARARPAVPQVAAESRSALPGRRRAQFSLLRRVADRVSNPVLARDLRGRPLGNADVIARAGLYGFVVAELVMLAGVGAFMYFDFVAKAMATAVAVSAFLAAIPAAMSIAMEKEQGTLEMVLATLLRPRTILAGKLAAAFWQAQPLILLAMPIGVLSAALDIVPWRSAALMLAFAESFALATCAIGVLASLLARRPARAVTTTSCIIAVIALGPLLVQRLGISGLLGFEATTLGTNWIGRGALAVVCDVFLRPNQHHTAALLGVAIAAGIALLAFVAALALFRGATQRTIESG